MEQIEISEEEYKNLLQKGGVSVTDIYGGKYVIVNNILLKATVTNKDIEFGFDKDGI